MLACLVRTRLLFAPGVEKLAGYGDFLLGGVHCAVAERAVSGAFWQPPANIASNA